MSNLKIKNRILKGGREKQLVTNKGSPIKLSADLSPDHCRPEGSGTVYSMWWKDKIYNQEYCTL